MEPTKSPTFSMRRRKPSRGDRGEKRKGKGGTELKPEEKKAGGGGR